MTRTPAAHLECVDALHRLAGDAHGVTLTALARRLDCAPTQAGERVLALQGMGLVDADAAGALRLTADGERVAVRLVRRHRVLERFLTDVLALPWERVLGLAYESGFIWLLAVPMAPVVEGWLGLPAVAGLTLLFGVLRKELALQLLLTLAVARYGAVGGDLGDFMTGSQIFTYTLVNTLSVPCVATIAVMGRELGWRRAALVAAFTIALAVTAGGLVRLALA